jgi:hypothetical protein
MDCYHQELCLISDFHSGVNETFALGSFSPTPTINSLPVKTGSSILTFTDLKESFYVMIVQLRSSWGHMFTYTSPHHTAGFVFWNILLLCVPLNLLLCFSFLFFHTQFWGDDLWFNLVKPQHILENQRGKDICTITTKFWKWQMFALTSKIQKERAVDSKCW